MEHQFRKAGIHFNRKGFAEAVLWAPQAKKALLRLSGGKGDLALEPEDLGYWSVQTGGIKPGDRYHFIIDDGKPLPDPASLLQPEGVHGASEAVNLSDHNWKDGSWKNIPLDKYIIYELHTGTFSESGTFEGIIEKLDYLKDLGINAIELMPVAQFPGDRNWGYDGVFPFAVQNNYGGPAGLQQLVDACHQKGIAVILDVVYNHLGPEGNYLPSFGPYFTDKYKTPWGGAINFDDAWCDGVRHFFIQNAVMWFRDFHIDALRLDAVHAIRDFSAVHILRAIREEVDQLMKQTGQKHHLIVELDLNDPKFISPVTEGGYGMDAQWVDEFHHALRVSAGGDRHGYYEDFSGIHHLAKAYSNAYVYDGQFSPHRKKFFGVPATGHPGEQFIVFSQNHDQVGNRMLGERTSRLVSFEMQKLLAGAVMVSPFIPMLFMGEEWSEPNPFQYFVSHTNPALVDAVRKGRKEEFAAFHLQGEAPDPVSAETFQRSKLQWNLLKQDQHALMLQYYKAIIALRRGNPILSSMDRGNLEVAADEKTQTLILRRWKDKNHIICFMNFSKQAQPADVPENIKWGHKVFDSSDAQWGGTPAAKGQQDYNESILLRPESIVIYSDTEK